MILDIKTMFDFGHRENWLTKKEYEGNFCDDGKVLYLDLGIVTWCTHFSKLMELP